jgi:hypothetical protein
VQEWIRHGVKLPFTSHPARRFETNRVQPEAEAFVDAEVPRLLGTGAVEVTERRLAHCILALSTTTKKRSPDKLRLVYDGRHVNEQMDVPTMRYEDLDTVQEMAEPGDWMETADLSEGFHHLTIRSQDRKFVCFEWRGVVYRWVALPFGLSCSPYFFVKTVRPCVLYLRARGLRLSSYMDDFLWLNALNTACAEDSLTFRREMRALGWTINEPKSTKEPTQRAEHLGMIVDTSGAEVLIRVPYDKLKRIRQEAQRLARTAAQGPVVLRNLARVAGLCLSVSRAVTPARLLLRACFAVIREGRQGIRSGRFGWNKRVQLTSSALEELNWWSTSLADWNGRAARARPHTAVLTTDASEWGFGATLELLASKDSPARTLAIDGQWTEFEAARSSNWRELKTVDLALDHWSAELARHSALVRSDNATTVAYVNRFGGKYESLHVIASALHRRAWAHGTELRAIHIAGVDNVVSDALSRLNDKTDWRLRKCAFKRLEAWFGPHTVDRFASRANTRLPRYNSRTADPGAEAVDCLYQNWSGENNYACPPFALIGRVLRLIELHRAPTTLIIPAWMHATWWSRMIKLTKGRCLKLSHADFKAGRSGKVEPWNNNRWAMVAVRIDFQ